MTINISPKLKQLLARVNWPLLLFLLLFLNVKLWVKIAAIVMVYTYKPNFKFGLNLNNPRLPLFYGLIIIIAVFNFFIYYQFSYGYNIAFITGLCFWLVCLLALHQLKLFVESTPADVLHHTIVLFFSINMLLSGWQLLSIIVETGHLNPYRYQGNYQKYFLNTGDYIKGATFDVSITNAAISAFSVIYFFVRQNARMFLLSMVVLLITASNTVNIILFVVLGALFLWRTNRAQKSLIVVSLMMLLVFMLKVSPQNGYYIDKMYNKVLFNKNISFDTATVKETRVTDLPDSTLSPELKQQKIAQLYLDSLTLSLQNKQVKSSAKVSTITAEQKPILALPQDSIHTATFQSRGDTDAVRKKLLTFISSHKTKLALAVKPPAARVVPGKLIALRQTINFLTDHPMKIITGTGMGNFSSKLAFRTTAMDIAGGYPKRFAYIDPGFLKNHFDVYLDFFSKRKGMHSVLNSPNSVYDQLLSEYGLAGVLIFLLTYTGFFLRKYQLLSYGIPLLAVALGVFFTDYWFEQLSIVVLLELLLFTDLKENELKPVAA